LVLSRASGDSGRYLSARRKPASEQHSMYFSDFAPKHDLIYERLCGS
jgi:hypothetical protein